jgi:hypothetical protein
MDWELVASEAVARYTTARHAAEEQSESRVGRWLRAKFLRKSQRGCAAVPRETGVRAPGYYVDSSDWPTRRFKGDASAEQAMQALHGLSDYYAAAMVTLRRTPMETRDTQ